MTNEEQENIVALLDSEQDSNFEIGILQLISSNPDLKDLNREIWCKDYDEFEDHIATKDFKFITLDEDGDVYGKVLLHLPTLFGYHFHIELEYHYYEDLPLPDDEKATIYTIDASCVAFDILYGYHHSHTESIKSIIKTTNFRSMKSPESSINDKIKDVFRLSMISFKQPYFHFLRKVLKERMYNTLIQMNKISI